MREAAGTAPLRAGAVPAVPVAGRGHGRPWSWQAVVGERRAMPAAGRPRGGSRSGREAMRPSGGRDRSSPAARGGLQGQRQLSLIVAVPPEPVVYDRFGSDSQVTDPSGFFLMYLYWKVVFGGSGTVADQVG